MQEFLVAVVAFPTIVFTFGLGVTLLYWLVVIFGALDLDFLDSALGLDSIDATLDGALESIDGMAIDGMADGAVEGAAESIDAAIDAAALMPLMPLMPLIRATRATGPARARSPGS